MRSLLLGVLLALLAHPADAAQCSVCEPGSYCFADASTRCPDHSSSAGGSGNITACVCDDGYYAVGHECAPCPADFYCLAEAKTACPANSGAPEFSSLLAACLCDPGHTGDSSAGCTACPAGTYKTTSGSAACTPCAVNTFSTATARTGACDACAANTVAPEGSDEAADCVAAAGYFHTDTGVAACPAGTYQPLAGQSACEECGSGFYSTATNATSAATCRACPAHSLVPQGSGTQLSDCVCVSGYAGHDGGPCEACAPGYYKDNSEALDPTQCLACPADTYSTTQAATSSSVCLACMADSSAPVGSSSLADCICDAGFRRDADTCVACAAGTVQDGTDDSRCVTCAAGSYEVQHTVCEPCAAHSNSPPGATACTCNAGYEDRGGTCTACDAGTYAPSQNSTCQPCAPSTWTASLASLSCAACPEHSGSTVTGSTSVQSCVCAAGYAGEAGECTICAAGTFHAAGTTTCTSCGADTYSGADGATACLACGADASAGSGATACTCDPGYTPSGLGCVPCAAGTAKATAGNATCAACAPGSFSGAAATACTPCALNTYQDAAGADACLACPQNSVSPSGSDALADCECVAGFGFDGGACVACPHGEYKTTTGNEACQACAAGNYTESTGATTADSCLLCGHDSYVADGQCVPCVANSESPEGSTSRDACLCSAGFTPNTPQVVSPVWDFGALQTYQEWQAYATALGGSAYLDQNYPQKGWAGVWMEHDMGHLSLPLPSEFTSVTVQWRMGSGFAGQTGLFLYVPGEETQQWWSSGALMTVTLDYAPGSSVLIQERNYASIADVKFTFPSTEVYVFGCSACAAGFYKDTTGSALCDACAGGYVGNAVDPRTSAAACSPCPADTYKASDTLCAACAVNSSAPAASDAHTACTCDLGFSGPDGGPCAACGAGAYKNWTGAGSCLLCARGTFSSAAAATSPDTCVACHAHSTQLVPAPYTSASECECLAGYEPVQGACVACADGKWKGAGDFGCVPCPATAYYPASAEPPYTEDLCRACPGNSSSASGAFGVAACVCDVGFLRSGDTCALCAAGRFCPDESTATSCPAHKTSPPGASSVLACTCKPGWHGAAGAGACSYCPVDHYCPGGAALQVCPHNASTLTRLGQTNVTACVCGPGFYESLDGTCKVCPVGSYCSRDKVVQCPANSTSVAKADTVDDCLCFEGFKRVGDACEQCAADVLCRGGFAAPEPCAAGALVHAQTCVCAAGSFCPATADGGCLAPVACDACPADHWCADNDRHGCPDGMQASVGSDALADCTCLAGTYHVGDACAECPADSYCLDGARFACAAFDPHLGSDATGNARRELCACDYGYFRLSHTDACKACPRNFYCPHEAAYVLPNVVACGPNEHTRDERSSAESECICDAGFALTEDGDAAACAPCEPGQRCQNGFVVEFMCHVLNRVPNADHTKCVCMPAYGEYELTCIPCLEGSIKPAAGDYACHYCPMNSYWVNATYCAPCPAHSQSDPGSLACTCDAPYVMQNGECVLCPPDTFYDGGHCAACPLNASSPAGSAALAACVCDPGHFRVQNSNGTSCLPCPAGTFERAGACVACGRGATSPPAATDAAACQCNASACQRAVWGWDCEGACEAAPEPCDECAAGYAKGTVSPVGNTAQCAACGVATYQPATGASACVACAPTESHVKLGQTNVSSCECVAGYEPSGNASAPCQRCAPGYYKGERGDWPCAPCAVGSFADAEGSLACTACAVATQSAHHRSANTTLYMAATSILDCTCSAGLYLVNHSGYAQCTPCAPGSFKASKGTQGCAFCGAEQAHAGTSFEHHHGTYAAGATSDAHCSPCPDFSGQNASLVGLGGVVLDEWTDCVCFGGHHNLTRAGCAACPEYQFKVGFSRALCAFCANGTFFTTRFQECGTCELRAAESDLHVGFAINRLDPALQWGVDEADCACRLGYERVGDRCHACPLGQFRGARSARQCGNCAPDAYTNTTAALACTACPAHSTTLGRNGTGAVTGCICDAGFQWNAETLECDACAAGTFRSADDVLAETLACVTCPADHYSLAQADACTPCPAHERADAGAPSLDHCNCVPGFGDNGAGGCALCPNATFSAGGNEDGSRHPACVDCPAHRNSTRGSTLVTDCLCVPGYGAGPGACVPCADGFYSLGGHNNSCTSCGWGAISEPPLAATSFDACLCNAAIGVYEAGI